MENKSKFYDGTKLLSLTDIDGDKPEIIICTSNRSAGKTTWFNRYFVKRFKEHGEKFMLIYRYKYEIEDCAEKFFKDIRGLFFHGDTMESKARNGIYRELYLNNRPCGYAISLNSADQLKKYSHLFSDTTRMLFDEFQSENNDYLSDEIKKFISVHTSVSRGQGSQSRYVPVYMLSNNVNILNPYYAELGIGERLMPDTNFLRGKGYVLEQGFNESACLAQQGSKFMQAFSGNDYVTYSGTKGYLYTDGAFIERLNGANNYICTLRFDGKEYAIKEYPNEQLMYCDENVDKYFKLRIAVGADDLIPTFSLRTNNDTLIKTLRRYFDNGYFRFKNRYSKNAVINLLKY